MADEKVFRDGSGDFFHKGCLEPADLASGLYTGIAEADIPGEDTCQECGGPLDEHPRDLSDDDDEEDEDDDAADDDEDMPEVMTT